MEGQSGKLYGRWARCCNSLLPLTDRLSIRPQIEGVVYNKDTLTLYSVPYLVRNVFCRKESSTLVQGVQRGLVQQKMAG